MSATAETIRQFILTKYLPGESPENLKDDTPLRSSGILNSLATLSLISFLEDRFAIEVQAHETDIDNFDRLGDIVAFVERKRYVAALACVREARGAGVPESQMIEQIREIEASLGPALTAWKALVVSRPQH